MIRQRELFMKSFGTPFRSQAGKQPVEAELAQRPTCQMTNGSTSAKPAVRVSMLGGPQCSD